MKSIRPSASILILAVIAVVGCAPLVGMISADVVGSVCGTMASSDFMQGKDAKIGGCPEIVISPSKHYPEPMRIPSKALEAQFKTEPFHIAAAFRWPLGKSLSNSMVPNNSLYRQSILLLI